MKIALAQINYHIGNFEANQAKMLQAIAKAKANGVDLVLFAELAVCGYPPRDFLEFRDFIHHCTEVVNNLAAASYGIGIIVGGPTVNPRTEGKDLFNTAFFIADGKVQAEVHKALLPTYDIFDENRYFEPGKEFKVVEFRGQRIAITVCEDIWNVGNHNPLYTTCPMDELIQQQPDFMVNISASPFSYSQAETRINVCKANCQRYKLPLFYVNHVGAQTELIFDGGSLVLAANAMVYDELPYWEEAYREYNLADIQATTDLSILIDVLRQLKHLCFVHIA